jgi:hypothetical protein
MSRATFCLGTTAICALLPSTAWAPDGNNPPNLRHSPGIGLRLTLRSDETGWGRMIFYRPPGDFLSVISATARFLPASWSARVARLAAIGATMRVCRPKLSQFLRSAVVGGMRRSSKEVGSCRRLQSACRHADRQKRASARALNVAPHTSQRFSGRSRGMRHG